jgi:hypothetical protein
MLGAAFMLAAAAGCSGSSQQNAGSVRVAVSSSALATGVTEVIVTVGPGTGLPSFTPFSVALSNVQGTWSGYITNIPAGTQRTFDVVANDSSHAQLQAGSGKADVAAGKSAVVVVTMGSTVPSNPFGNNAPVIDYVSASQTNVLPGGTVRLSISAHDPDPGDTVTILWSAACGTIDAPASSVVTWTAPAATGPCQITAKASDNRGASVSVYLSLDVAAATSGDVLVEVKDGGNASPVITAMTADVQYRSPVQGSLSVQATDPNGDTLAYAWSSNCATVTFATPAAATTTFTNSDGSKSCVVTVDVTDGKGGKVTGDVTLPPNILFNLAPVITHTVQPSVDLTDLRLAQPVSPGDAVLLSVEAKDPENLNLTFTWTTNAGTLDGQVDLPIPTGTPAPHVTTSPGKSVILFHVGATIPADAKVTVTVRDPGNEATSHDYNFKAATGTGPCASQPNGTTCDDGNPCTTTSSCQGGVCVGANPVVCAAPAACKQAGVCQTSGPSAGTCTYADSATGTACDDGRACTSPDTCAAGVCMSGPSTCTGGQTCSAAGVCVPGACVPACTGKTCGPDGCGGVCGTCTGTDVCSAAGTCGPPVCTPNCTGKTCGPDGCGGTCAPGCTGTNTCNASGVCVPPAGSTVVAPKIAKFLNLSRLDGISSSGTTSFISGTAVFSPAIDVDGSLVSGPGGADVFVSQYNMTTGAPIWRKTYGDDLDQFGAANSAPTADGTLAVVGRVAPAGRIGECVAGAPVTCTGVVASNTNAFESDFLMLLNAATGTVKSGTSVISNGISGKLTSVAVNPALNLIAVCGVVSSTSSLCQGTTPASCTASTAYQGGLTDLVLAVFNSAGTLQWARQVGGAAGVASDESCNAIAIAGDGTVWAAGRYQGSLDLGTGALPTLPNLTATRHMWVAHFSSTGATLASQAFGTQANRCAGNPTLACTAATVATDCAGLTPATCTTAPVGNVVPNDMQIDSGGNLVVGGSFTASFPVGGLVSAGGTDAFVVKLTPALAGVWGVRLGNTGSDATNALAIGPSDDVVAVGSYSGVVSGTPTTGAAALTAPSGTAAQAFILKLAAGTGATHSAGGYGDAAVQQGTRLTVSGTRVQFGGSVLGVIDFGPPTTPVDAGTLAAKSYTTFADIQ